MHIPKTAGSFVTDVVTCAIGADHCAPLVDAELVHLGRGRGLPPRRAEFVSAHMCLAELVRQGMTERYQPFTVLRDPMDRLVSHLNWLDRYNHGVDRDGLARRNPDAKRLVHELARTDPEDSDSLARLFRLDKLTKGRMLFNRQATSLFAQTAWDVLDLIDVERLSRADMADRIRALMAIGTLDQFKDAMAAAGFGDQVERSVNAARTRRFRRTPLLEQVAARYIAKDQMLYDLVLDCGTGFDPVFDWLGHMSCVARAAPPSQQAAL